MRFISATAARVGEDYPDYPLRQIHRHTRLSQIGLIACCTFRKHPAAERQDAVEEVIASTFVDFARLVERGKESITDAWPLGRYEVAQDVGPS